MRLYRLALCAGLLSLLLGLACVPSRPADAPSHLDRARAAAEGSSDPDVVGAWLLAELIAPGGKLARAEAARKRLASLPGGGIEASLARAVDADIHGRFAEASRQYLASLTPLSRSARGDAPIYAWFAANRLVALRSAVADAWKQAAPVVQKLMKDPGNIGWRARGELVEWWSVEAFHDLDGPDVDELMRRVQREHGCVTDALMAGPFGRGAPSDHRVHFEAEAPAPWPARFARDVRGGQQPAVVALSDSGCLLRPETHARAGVYYVQTFLDLDRKRDVLIAVQGAYALFVDDTEVLTRDMAQWGVWPRFGVRLELSAGRHRLLARLVNPEASIRVLTPAGTPAGVKASADQGAGYVLQQPRLMPDPNALEPLLRHHGVPPRAGAPKLGRPYDFDDPVMRYAAAYLAHVEAQDDIASVLFEPLVKKASVTTPASLAQQAVFVDGDPIYPPGVARDLARDLRERAAEADAKLWGPRLWLTLERREKAEPSEIVVELERLMQAFPEVPMVVAQLVSLYGQLGWKAEQLRALEAAQKRFPDDIDVLHALVEVYQEAGRIADADALIARIREIDPTDEIDFRQALARGDYDAAIAELERIGKLRKDRRDIAIRIADLLVRAGKSNETMAALEMALEDDPSDAGARLALADARFATGKRQALNEALVDAITEGAEDAALREAIELIDGVTDLEPYRRDGLAVVEQVKQSGVELPGTASRILDYGVLWISRDGTARMLEHEIVRIQSREGIARHVEQQIPRGVVLRMRTIKADGRVLEPELVSGKPTVTMPHLEVGDYIETEHILTLGGASRDGRRYVSPRWFFREENTSYHISEWVVVSPPGRDLAIETTGAVPPPQIDHRPGLTVHRWRVEGSVALPEEPVSAPIQEFLPSVRVGWGIDVDEQLRRLVELMIDDAPADPRMVRIAKTIIQANIGGKPSGVRLGTEEQARRVYRWVLDTIEEGQETVGPRIITGKQGDPTRAFLYLCRLAGIDARLGLVRDRLAPPPRGPFSEAEAFGVPAVRIVTEKGNRWLSVRERFAPFGYLPSSLRGQPAVVIQTREPITTVEPPLPSRERTDEGGGQSGIVHQGEVELRADGSALMHLTQTYHDRYAIQLRGILAQVSESRRTEVVEAQLLGLALPGGRLQKLDTPNLDALDEPVKLAMDLEVPTFARVAEGELSLEVPFLGSLARLVALPSRETPLYISERMATRARVALTVTLPEGAKALDLGAPLKIEDARLSVFVGDRVEGDKLLIERDVSIPAGRIQPEAYAAFKEMVLRGDEALNRKVRIQLR